MQMNKIQLSTPTLVFFSGLPSSGKSTISRKLVENLVDSLILDKDTVNDSFLRSVGDSQGLEKYALTGRRRELIERFYYDHVRFQSYHCLLNLARDNLRVGKHPVIDAPYVKEIPIGYFQEIVFPFFKGVDYRFKLVFCYASEDEIRRRMIGGGKPRDRYILESPESWRAFLEKEPLSPPNLDGFDHLKLNTEKPEEHFLRELFDYISS